MLHPGMNASVTLRVASADTAESVGSGDVPVLATPRLIALCEEATVAVVAGHLDASETTVGVSVHFEHLAASALGSVVTATATLIDLVGRVLIFEVAASDGQGTVAEGRVERTVVDKERFLEEFGG